MEDPVETPRQERLRLTDRFSLRRAARRAAVRAERRALDAVDYDLPERHEIFVARDAAIGKFRSAQVRDLANLVAQRSDALIRLQEQEARRAAVQGELDTTPRPDQAQATPRPNERASLPEVVAARRRREARKTHQTLEGALSAARVAAEGAAAAARGAVTQIAVLQATYEARVALEERTALLRCAVFDVAFAQHHELGDLVAEHLIDAPGVPAELSILPIPADIAQELADLSRGNRADPIDPGEEAAA